MPDFSKNSRNQLLKNKLERLYRQYNREFLFSDPVAFVHRYSNPADQEVVAWIASVLSYGNVPQIQRSLTTVLSKLSENPFQFLKHVSPDSLTDDLISFRHRFTTGEDIIVLLYLIQQILQEYGTVGRFFQQIFSESDGLIRNLLSKVVQRLKEKDFGAVEPFYRGRKFWYLLPSPDSGSACKRWNMFLRWMVRRKDGVDLGLWTEIPTSVLILPLDTHTARLSRFLGLSRLKNASWKMAEEVTRNLRQLDPSDPVKYDFALSRLGILKLCPGKKQTGVCEKCPLFPFCVA